MAGGDPFHAPEPALSWSCVVLPREAGDSRAKPGGFSAPTQCCAHWKVPLTTARFCSQTCVDIARPGGGARRNLPRTSQTYYPLRTYVHEVVDTRRWSGTQAIGPFEVPFAFKVQFPRETLGDELDAGVGTRVYSPVTLGTFPLLSEHNNNNTCLIGCLVNMDLWPRVSVQSVDVITTVIIVTLSLH